MKTKVALLIATALIAWGLKRHYAGARVDDLWWILRPTAEVVTVVTGTTFTLQAGEGYFSRERLFLIEKSCAGVNFMIAAFGMLVFTLRHRAASSVAAAQVVAASLLASYAAAVLVNAVRIAIAMWLAANPVSTTAFSAADVHRLEGIIVYFGGLVLLYAFAQRLDQRALAIGTAVPLAFYYAVTLGLPLANGAAQSDSFVKHAAIVLVVPPLAIVLAWAGYAALARLTHECD